MRLSENVCYQYKVYVLPEFRGQGVNTRIIDYALTSYPNSCIDTLVTTTDITNQSFLASVTRHGFRRIAFAGEWVLFGKSFFWVPKPFFLNEERTQFIKMFGS